MAQVPFNSHIDLGNNEIQNAKFQLLASAPAASAGKFYYDTTLNKFGYYNGSEWIYGTVYIEGTGISINGNVISIDTDVVAQLTDLANYVPTTRTVNGKALSSNIVLTAADVGALPDSTTINDLTTESQQNALNSGATSSLINQISTNETDISTIQGLIPSQATSQNQLADKEFVNSTIQTNTANFRGNWATWGAVPSDSSDYPDDYAGSKVPTVNDYLVVQDASDYTEQTLEGTWRFKYTGVWATDGKSGWLPEYQVNESPMTSAQLAALNSGITSELVAQIGTNQSNISTINGQITTINTTLGTKIQKFSALNETLVSSGGVCTWSVVNQFATADVQVAVYRVSDGVQVMTEVDVSASTIVIKFNSATDITAGIYKVIVQG